VGGVVGGRVVGGVVVGVAGAPHATVTGHLR